MFALSALSLTWFLLQNVILNIWISQVNNSQIGEVLLKYGVSCQGSRDMVVSMSGRRKWRSALHLTLRTPGSVEVKSSSSWISLWLSGPRLCVHSRALGWRRLSFGRIPNWELGDLDFSPNPALSLLSNLEWAHVNFLYFYFFSSKVGLLYPSYSPKEDKL